MALTNRKIAKITKDYEAGLDNKLQIAKKHNITPKTLYFQAEKHEWVYGKNTCEINEKAEKKSIEQFASEISKEKMKAIHTFVTEAKGIESLTIDSLNSLKSVGANQICKEDGERVFSVLKNCKIAMETLNISFLGKRKALGMDVPEESKPKGGDIQLVICSEGG